MKNFAESSAIEAEFLTMLVCPSTRQPLRWASEAELKRLNLDAALVRDDGLIAYPVREGIPVLLADAAVRLG